MRSILLSVAILLAARMASGADLPAFPGAEGFGALATGGRGGEIVHVTTLAESGPGSIRDAVSRPGRIVIFDVSGIIALNSNLEMSDNLTLLGQSSPAGITLYNKTASFSNHKNIIVRYLRFREGINGDRGKCAVNLSTGSNMIFDHCSIEWGRWDCLGCTVNSHDITFQNCIIGEGLDPQQFGALVDTVENITISHNLWINNHSRNPKGKGTIQYINNVVYNWGITGLCGGHSAADHSLDVVGNYFIKGPSSNNQALGQFTGTDKVFQRGNMIDLDRDGKLTGKLALEADFKDKEGSPSFQKEAWAKPKIPVTVDSAEMAYQKVVSGAGSSLHRDAIDTRLIGELTSLGKEGKIIKDEKEIGGIGTQEAAVETKDSGHDGIPDAWRAAHHLNPNDPGDARKLDASGYMMIEVYLNELTSHP